MKYIVELKHVEYLSIEVEADSFDEAQDIAEDADFDDYTVYHGDDECLVTTITDETGKLEIVGF